MEPASADKSDSGVDADISDCGSDMDEDPEQLWIPAKDFEFVRMPPAYTSEADGDSDSADSMRCNWNTDSEDESCDSPADGDVSYTFP